MRPFRRNLVGMLSVWVEQQLISVSQARAICQTYDIDYDNFQHRFTAHRLLIVLGCLFIGLALITIIGANWDTIPRALRLTGLLILTACFHAIGIWHYQSRRQSLAIGFFLLGNFSYGASILLIAQTYHLGEHMPNGVFLWALGSLPSALLLRNSMLTLFCGLLALVWLYLEIATGFLNITFFSIAFPLFILAELYVAFTVKSGTLLFLTLFASTFLWIEVLLMLLWMGNSGPLQFSAEHIIVSMMVLILAYATSCWLTAKDNEGLKYYGALLSMWVLGLTLLTMLVLSYEEPWEALVYADWNSQLSMWVVSGVIAALALLISAHAGKLRAVMLLVVVCSVTMIPVIDGRLDPFYLQIAGNIALVATGICLIVLGANQEASRYFFLGITVILLTALMRYIDLVGDYVGTSILFIVHAVLLLGAARYWQHRQTRENSQ